MNESAKTVELMTSTVSRAKKVGLLLKTHNFRDGRTGYRIVDNISGRVYGQSRNYMKIQKHLSRLTAQVAARV